MYTKYEDADPYVKGWTDATVSIIKIWEGLSDEFAGNKSMIFEAFRNFLDICQLRLSGASDRDIVEALKLQSTEFFGGNFNE